MTRPAGVLLLGATGQTGRRALAELLTRDVPVRALVRSAEGLPAELRDHPLLEVVEAEIASMSADRMRDHLAECDTAISCLGHTITLRGVFGPPRDLVERAVRTVVDAARSRERGAPFRVILMGSVSVHRPGERIGAMGRLERAFLAMIRALVPPARDNQRAADLLADEVGTNEAVSWVVVRPDTLLEGEATAYVAHQHHVARLFRALTTRRANVARFIADLVTDRELWESWRGRMPVVVDEGSTHG